MQGLRSSGSSPVKNYHMTGSARRGSGTMGAGPMVTPQRRQQRRRPRPQPKPEGYLNTFYHNMRSSAANAAEAATDTSPVANATRRLATPIPKGSTYLEVAWTDSERAAAESAVDAFKHATPVSSAKQKLKGILQRQRAARAAASTPATGSHRVGAARATASTPASGSRPFTSPSPQRSRAEIIAEAEAGDPAVPVDSFSARRLFQAGSIPAHSALAAEERVRSAANKEAEKQRAKLIKVFRSFDDTMSGRVTHEDFRKALHYLQVDRFHTRREIDSWIARVDAAQEGTVDYTAAIDKLRVSDPDDSVDVVGHVAPAAGIPSGSGVSGADGPTAMAHRGKKGVGGWVAGDHVHDLSRTPTAAAVTPGRSVAEVLPGARPSAVPPGKQESGLRMSEAARREMIAHLARAQFAGASDDAPIGGAVPETEADDGYAPEKLLVAPVDDFDKGAVRRGTVFEPTDAAAKVATSKSRATAHAPFATTSDRPRMSRLAFEHVREQVAEDRHEDVKNLVRLKMEAKSSNFQKLFRAMDTDKDGTMSYEEFGRGIENLGVKLSADQLDRLVAIVDQDRSGNIDYEEFRRVLSRKDRGSDQERHTRKVWLGSADVGASADEEVEHHIGPVSSAEPTADDWRSYEQLLGTVGRLKTRIAGGGGRLWKLLRSLDSDEDGCVRYGELRKAMVRTVGGMADDDLRVISEHLDADHTGLIDYYALSYLVDKAEVDGTPGSAKAAAASARSRLAERRSKKASAASALSGTDEDVMTAERKARAAMQRPKVRTMDELGAEDHLQLQSRGKVPSAQSAVQSKDVVAWTDGGPRDGALLAPTANGMVAGIARRKHIADDPSFRPSVIQNMMVWDPASQAAIAEMSGEMRPRARGHVMDTQLKHIMSNSVRAATTEEASVLERQRRRRAVGTKVVHLKSPPPSPAPEFVEVVRRAIAAPDSADLQRAAGRPTPREPLVLG